MSGVEEIRSEGEPYLYVVQDSKNSIQLVKFQLSINQGSFTQGGAKKGANWRPLFFWKLGSCPFEFPTILS